MFSKKVLKEVMKDALTDFFKSEEGEEILGNISMKASDQSFIREIQIEDGKSEPGKKVIRTEKVNAVDFLMKYLPDVEARVLGYQADSSQAKNYSAKVLQDNVELKNKLDAIGNIMVHGIEPALRKVAEIESRDEEIKVIG